MEYFDILLKKIDERISNLNLDSTNMVVDARNMVLYLQKEIQNLKKHIVHHTFANEQEEIDFFKKKKPQILGRLIYYNEIYQIETHCPLGREEVMKDYFNKMQDKHKSNIEENIAFYQYYKSGATYRDKQLFTRGNLDIHLSIDNYFFEADPDFSTYYDFKVATILAHEMLFAYLTKRKKDLEKYDETSVTLPVYHWTDSKSAAVELIYGIYVCNCINNGTVGIHEIASRFSAMFDIDLGDFYHTYLSFKNRKSSLTLFLDSMSKKLKEYMEKEEK